MLRKIDRVQIGVYENSDWRSYKPHFNSLREITSDLKDDGYECIVRTINSDEMTAVMVKTNSEKLKEMFVVVVNENELVMTQIFGDLDELIEIVIREEGLNVELARN